MKYKNLYWDIETEVKMKKVEQKTGVSTSKALRTLIKKTTLEDMIKLLQKEIEKV